MRMETNLNPTKKRDISIDILRFIGISFIILAHVNPPDTILNIRCFDVSLMLFVSGLTMSTYLGILLSLDRLKIKD